MNVRFHKKKNNICILMNHNPNIDFCTFTGDSIDILMGLIFLLKKHKNACSLLTKQFVENPILFDEYKKERIVSNLDFLNIDIVWLNKKLYLPVDFNKLFKQCINSNKRFIIIPVGILLVKGGHANYLLYDKTKKELERFEPHGSSTPYGFNYEPELLNNQLKLLMNSIDESIVYISPSEYLPKIAFQKFDAYDQKCKKISDPDGFCAVWTVWYIDYRLKYKDIPRKDLVDSMLNQMKENNISFKNIIRNYSKNIFDLRDEVLIKTNTNINDWNNRNITIEQTNSIINNIGKIILDLKNFN
jgi:hypothetical protein